MNWDGNNTSYMTLPVGRQQTGGDHFPVNEPTDIRLCYRCGEEGHVRNHVTQTSIVSFVNHTHIKRQFADLTQTL